MTDRAYRMIASPSGRFPSALRGDGAKVEANATTAGAFCLSAMRGGACQMDGAVRRLRAWNSLVEELPRETLPQGLSKARRSGGRPLGFVGLPGPAYCRPAGKPVSPNSTASVAGVCSRLGDSGRRGSRDRQIDTVTPGCGGDRRRSEKPRQRRRVPPTSPARRRSIRFGCVQSGSVSPRARSYWRPPAACATSSPRSTGKARRAW